MKKIVILAAIALTSVIHAKMYVPAGATQAQQQQAVLTERMLQQGNVHSVGNVSSASNVNTVGLATYGDAPASVSTSSSSRSQSSYTQSTGSQSTGTTKPDSSQSGFLEKIASAF